MLNGVLGALKKKRWTQLKKLEKHWAIVSLCKSIYYIHNELSLVFNDGTSHFIDQIICVCHNVFFFFLLNLKSKKQSLTIATHVNNCYYIITSPDICCLYFWIYCRSSNNKSDHYFCRFDWWLFKCFDWNLNFLSQFHEDG